jgi:outer membrane protein W
MKHYYLLILLLPSLLFAVPNNTRTPNSVELRAGVSSSEGKTNPMGSLLYQHFLSDNWAIGVAIQPILASRQLSGGSYLENAAHRTITIIPIDFTVGYFFTMDSALQPFIRGYAGPAVVRGAGAAEELFHFGVGGGFRYFFDDEIYATAELSGNVFALQDKTRSQNGPFFQAGVGIAF